MRANPSRACLPGQAHVRGGNLQYTHDTQRCSGPRSHPWARLARCNRTCWPCEPLAFALPLALPFQTSLCVLSASLAQVQPELHAGRELLPAFHHHRKSSAGPGYLSELLLRNNPPSLPFLPPPQSTPPCFLCTSLAASLSCLGGLHSEIFFSLTPAECSLDLVLTYPHPGQGVRLFSFYTRSRK